MKDELEKEYLDEQLDQILDDYGSVLSNEDQKPMPSDFFKINYSERLFKNELMKLATDLDLNEEQYSQKIQQKTQ